MHVVYLLIACDVIKNQAARGQITEQFKDHLYTHQERNMMGECDIKNTSFVLNTKWQLVWEAGRADSVGRTASVFTADREEGGQQRLKDSRSALYWEPETTRRTAPIVLLFLSIVNPLGRWSNPSDNAPLQWMDALPTEKRDCFNPSIVWLCWWRMRRDSWANRLYEKPMAWIHPLWQQCDDVSITNKHCTQATHLASLARFGSAHINDISDQFQSNFNWQFCCL